MSNWWRRKKENTRKHRKGERYTFGDFIMDVLFWIPELVLLPFRLLFWLLRGLWKINDLT
ncbi:hypothetical protein [Ornithinibacillus californiensis]|uniref:hypothetical protein n=1 Tax=Ornithinibacillus californiensis TaxID=161536 RepID=UPI00064DD7D2|nr:hypothetical protein [Ornithinibacillus californiensis]